jgi:hypothetical protein
VKVESEPIPEATLLNAALVLEKLNFAGHRNFLQLQVIQCDSPQNVTDFECRSGL